MGAVQTLNPPVRLRMGYTGADVGDTRRLYQRTPLVRKKLTAMIVDDLRFAFHPVGKRLQRLLDGQAHGIGAHGQVQRPVYQKSAVPVENVDEVVPART